MPSMKPSFRRGPDGCLLLTCSVEAKVIKNQHRERCFAVSRPAAVVRKEAEEMVKKAGADVNNSKHLLGCLEIQFECFRWILENYPGYAGYLVDGMEKDESKPTGNRWINKMALKKYVELWAEGKEILEMKKKQQRQRSTPTMPRQIKVTGVSLTTKAEKPDTTDDEFLLATQEMEQEITAGKLYGM